MGEVLGPMSAMFFLGWVVWAVLAYLRRTRVMKVQSETRSKILEKIGAGEEMAEFMKTEAGQRLLEPLPVEAQAATPKEFGRILRAVQAGVVLAVLGAGIMAVSASIHGGNQESAALGGIVMALGIGFLLAGAASYVLSRSWGLLNGEPTE